MTSFRHRLADQDQLSLRSALVAGAVISSVVLIAVGLALMMNASRQNRVLSRYTQETQQHLSRRSEGFEALFTATMAACQQQLAAAQALDRASNQYPPTDVICEAGRQQLAALEVDQLQDSSAIAYLRVVGDQYELLEASGKYSGLRPVRDGYNHFSYDKKQDLIDYLMHDEPVSLWADYIQFIPGKEVIVPVTNRDDDILGYIFRGVIER